MARAIWSWIAVPAIGLAVGGCTTGKLVEYADRVETRKNEITDVAEAWQTPEGRVVLCVIGWPAAGQTGQIVAMYRVSVSANAIAAAGRPERPPDSPASTVAEFHLAPEAIGQSCEPKPERAERIPIRNVGPDAFTAAAEAPLLDAALREDVEVAPKGKVVYLPGGGEGRRLDKFVLTSRDGAAEEPRVARLILPTEESQPNRVAYAALPLAVAVDVIDTVFTVIVFGTLIVLIVVAV